MDYCVIFYFASLLYLLRITCFFCLHICLSGKLHSPPEKVCKRLGEPCICLFVYINCFPPFLFALFVCPWISWVSCDFLFTYLFACLIAFLQRKFVSPEVSRVVGHLGTKQPSLPGAFMQRSGASPLLSCVHINDSVVVWTSMQRCGPLPSKRMYDDILFDTSEHSYFGAKLSVTSTIH